MDHLAYVIFNRDSTRAEMFVNSHGAQSTVLERRQTATGPVWNVEDDDTYNVRRVDGDWLIERRGQVVYRHDAKLNPIHARFNGSDGISRMFYPVEITFFPAGEAAIVTVGDQTYRLRQYPTGSGYGYKNDRVELRGKGEEATLTYTDENQRNLELRQVHD
ncbi:MAG: MliC family protein [Rikenellaceae bacterium]|nr:MliC family protein [Rikenellaceae bacterium]